MTPTLYHTGATRPKVKSQQSDSIRLCHVPTIRINYLSPGSFRVLEGYLGRNPFVVFLSKHGVTGFHRWLNAAGKGVQLRSRLTWAVGRATRRTVLASFGASCRHPGEQSASGLIHAFKRLGRRPVVLISGKQSRPEFSAWLRQNGWDFLQIATYDTEEVKNSQLLHRFQNSREEYVLFTSPSTVRGFLKTFGWLDLKHIQSHLVSIGSTTTAEIRRYHGRVFYEAEQPSVPEVVRRLALEPIPTMESTR